MVIIIHALSGLLTTKQIIIFLLDRFVRLFINSLCMSFFLFLLLFAHFISVLSHFNLIKHSAGHKIQYKNGFFFKCKSALARLMYSRTAHYMCIRLLSFFSPETHCCCRRVFGLSVADLHKIALSQERQQRIKRNNADAHTQDRANKRNNNR